MVIVQGWRLTSLAEAAWPSGSWFLEAAFLVRGFRAGMGQVSEVVSEGRPRPTLGTSVKPKSFRNAHRSRLIQATTSQTNQWFGLGPCHRLPRYRRATGRWGLPCAKAHDPHRRPVSPRPSVRAPRECSPPVSRSARASPSLLALRS